MSSPNEPTDPFALPHTPSGRNPILDRLEANAAQTGRPVRSGLPAQADATPGTNYPCPCVCLCNNHTNKKYSEVESFDAAKSLRCDECAQKSHFGPRWSPAGSHLAALGAADEVVTTKNGASFVIRRNHEDPEDEALNRQIAEDIATEQRTQARDKWLASLPERWRMPYRDGETLVPEVEERLSRLADGDAAAHGTSLLCCGPFGTGKTWVAYTYARAAVDRRLLWPQEVRVGTEADIMEPIALAAPWEVSAKASGLLRPNLKLLIIDDVGALGTYKNEANRYATWSKVVNWAYEHKRAVVLTTNLSLGDGQELENWIGPTAYARLRHMVGRKQVFREQDKRAQMTAQWEAEYLAAQRGPTD
jgi:DNA replication protein DnaC